jgi:CHAT domain-containing protein
MPVKNNDFGYLIRLEDIEDKIANADDQLRDSVPGLSIQNGDKPIELNVIQRYIRPNEALLLHIVVSGIGLVTTCIDSNSWALNFTTLDQPEIKQLIIDEKLLSASVHGTHEPSSTLDANFPAESSYRLYKLFFGGVEACLTNKTHILLATDADFFALPWNALLTEAPPQDHEFHLREAPWLPKSYALSLLPSVQSIYQLRATLPQSQAQQAFLGVGDPEFGNSKHLTSLALASLYSSRGVANKAAIRDLPKLPDSGDELRVVANALGASTDNLLLGSGATERALRQRPLNDYRVISFATHAIVAGEIEGVTEPALVLTPGQEDSNTQNDGLLTASEIANLTLDANLVILSACNTAASDGHVSGRGLSGLANAFFFAGARAVAVTQWAVFSSVAQKLGAGLVSRSVNSAAVGVSEGLREAMMDYIESAKEDYLANPRFWGAFIIAGDGAVRPLDRSAQNGDANDTIVLEWDRVMPEPADSEIYGIANNPHSDTLYTIGMEKPPVNKTRAGAYFAQIPLDGNVQVIERDRDLAASGVVSLADKIGVLGFLARGDKSSSAAFRLLDQNGQRRWQHVEDGPSWSFPVSMIKAFSGYILISIETNFSGPSTLIVTSVSDQGDTLMQQRIAISIGPKSFSSKHVVLDASGNLVIAIGGSVLASSPAQANPSWTNPQTGTRRICTTAPEASEIFEVDVRSLVLNARKTIPNVSIASLELSDGHLYAAGSAVGNCRLTKRANFAEIGPGYELRTIFESKNVNSLEVHDLKITSNGVVLLAGTTRTFLPTAPTVAVMSPEELKNYKFTDAWDDSFWEQTESHGIGFILARIQLPSA